MTRKLLVTIIDKAINFLSSLLLSYIPIISPPCNTLIISMPFNNHLSYFLYGLKRQKYINTNKDSPEIAIPIYIPSNIINSIDIIIRFNNHTYIMNRLFIVNNDFYVLFNIKEKPIGGL